MSLISPIHKTKNEEKWARHYWKLMDRALFREVPDGQYMEEHHMLPKCMYGINKMIVRLTPEEHYVAHQLLVKIFPDEGGLAYGAYCLGNIRPEGRRNNKMYGWLKRRYSEARTGKPLTEETKQKISNTLKGYGLGKTIPIDQRQKISNTLKGHGFSEETKQKISKTLIETLKGKPPNNGSFKKGHITWNKGKTISEETRTKLMGNTNAKGRKLSSESLRKMSESAKGRKHTEEARAKMSLSQKVRKNRERVVKSLQKSTTGVHL